jgi:hypothetical protein
MLEMAFSGCDIGFANMTLFSTIPTQPHPALSPTPVVPAGNKTSSVCCSAPINKPFYKHTNFDSKKITQQNLAA